MQQRKFTKIQFTITMLRFPVQKSNFTTIDTVQFKYSTNKIKTTDYVKNYN
ncbi:hypothetical protein IV59_GL000881 [Paucilactobacillus hokkaidonensis]|uniref:Uncharacterized protein n=1 Tax=Paucilactobacillus hokkaidonensis TaxID=1193095 RepID=A0ABR5Q9E8_9LACO|nr:hypothetical protein IV59_GL000881 [Paucilactobacillus hokkaidonensis]